MAAATPKIPTLEEFRSHLRRHKLRATRQRLAVHRVMMELVHASADNVHEALQQGGTNISTAAVYNILTQLADYRIYGRRLSVGNKMYFDVVGTRHIHLYDRENHSYRDLADDELAILVASHLKHRKFKGYSLEDIDIQLIARPTRKKKSV